MTSKGRSAFATTIWFVLLIGCRGPETLTVKLVRVGGVVTLDGEPLEKAVVIFESDDRSFSFGETDADGQFDLRFDSRRRGATAGSKTVRISMNRRINGLNSTDEGGPDDSAGGSFPSDPPERIPARYNTASTLVVQVSASSRDHRFDLSSSGK